jgi:hypothetical protein
VDETKHVIVFKTAYFEVVVSHEYFDLLTYSTSHSVIDRILERDVGNIFAQDTQRSTQEKKKGDWDEQFPDRELLIGLSRDCVLRRGVTGPRWSQAPHVHRQYVRPWWKSLGGVIDRILERDVGNIFAQDTQRLENGNVRIPDVGIIHKITAHVDPSRRCGQLGDERNLQKCTFPRSVQDVRSVDTVDWFRVCFENA